MWLPLFMKTESGFDNCLYFIIWYIPIEDNQFTFPNLFYIYPANHTILMGTESEPFNKISKLWMAAGLWKRCHPNTTYETQSWFQLHGTSWQYTQDVSLHTICLYILYVSHVLPISITQPKCPAARNWLKLSVYILYATMHKLPKERIVEALATTPKFPMCLIGLVSITDCGKQANSTHKCNTFKKLDISL
jgi:hypothetical protein